MVGAVDHFAIMAISLMRSKWHRLLVSRVRSLWTAVHPISRSRSPMRLPLVLSRARS